MTRTLDFMCILPLFDCITIFTGQFATHLSNRNVILTFTAHKWDTHGLKFPFVDIQSAQQFKIVYCCRDPSILLSVSTGTNVYGKRESVPFMVTRMTLHFWPFTRAFWIESTNSHADQNSKRINCALCVYGTVLNFSLSTVDGNKRKYFASKNFAFISLFLFANGVFIQQTLFSKIQNFTTLFESYGYRFSPCAVVVVGLSLYLFSLRTFKFHFQN